MLGLSVRWLCDVWRGLRAGACQDTDAKGLTALLRSAEQGEISGVRNVMSGTDVGQAGSRQPRRDVAASPGELGTRVRVLSAVCRTELTRRQAGADTRKRTKEGLAAVHIASGKGDVRCLQVTSSATVPV
eukprot:3343277-Rhodomonas_salina.1